MADPERDFAMAYDEQGYVHILHSTFFDVDPEVDHTAQGYLDRILDTLVDAVEEQLGVVGWRLAPDPKWRYLLCEPFTSSRIKAINNG
ncbi:hypothetical protein M5K25_008054 [Dendrobium thyrsiflorum]|uniref:Uncharacterized protein n=1 Tax=Dendrobium thyrsiflorum TaxID=117978 RepID=A0ABD0VEG6_DENTH